MIFIIAKYSQLILFYLEDSISELNIYSASRPQSIRGLARLAGHDPMRSVAATGEFFLSYTGNNPNIYGDYVIIPNYTKISCKDNQLTYLLVLGKDEIKYNIFEERGRIFCRCIQGVIEQQSFTGSGASMQSFEANISGGQRIDNYFVNVFVNGKKKKKYDSLYDIPKGFKGYLIKTGITSGIDIYFGNDYFGAIPPLGSTIIVEYLITAGENGNINGTDGLTFEFGSDGYDVQGNEVDLNQVFNIGISNPITFGSDTESIQLTRILAPLTSRSFVLANTTNYETFFEKMQFFSYISAYTEYNELNWFIDNIIYLMLVPDIQKRLRSGENYFTVPIDFFTLTRLEKFKIQRLLEESGQKIVNSVVRFVDPQFKRYTINIYLYIWEGTDKDSMRKDIIDKISAYLINFKRKDYLPKSDLISIMENITGIDSVNMYFVSENIEQELKILTDLNTINNSTVIDNESKKILIEQYKTTTYDTTEKRLALVLENDTVNLFLQKHLDQNGDIVLNKNERPLVRGGWSDRNGVYYSDLIDKNKLCAININIIKENARDTNAQSQKYNINKIKND